MESGEEDYFAFLSLTGDRFDAPGMPVETAREVGNFREAILKIARDLWMDSNPDRQRLPNGFYEAFDLRLIDVESGSARPRMTLHRPARKVSDHDWDEWSTYYIQARDKLTDSLQSVAQTRQAPINLSPGAMRAIRRVGSSLQDSETMILGDPKQESRRAVIDHAVREILEEIEELAPTSESVQIEGMIVEYDGSTMSFRVKTKVGTSSCRLDHARHDLAVLAKEYLAADGITAPDVLIGGETADPTQKNIQLFNVTSIAAIRSIEEKALLANLDQIKGLQDGWLGPASEAPSADVVEKVRRVIPRIASLGTEVSIVPNSDGAIVIEWRRGDVEMSAAIEGTDELFLCADNAATDALLEKQTEFDEALLLRFLESGSMK
ncbi:hypothetical protein [Streptomyces sp. NBC_01262]|uniref:hypothetical protein n=1 Tax=Streptomyces sp. NBC_01262 TaxID=2903803 RepID=UPI002E2FE395|nr:hypothetical protein [Streptomyces sp. NBC_01262]